MVKQHNISPTLLLLLGRLVAVKFLIRAYQPFFGGKTSQPLHSTYSKLRNKIQTLLDQSYLNTPWLQDSAPNIDQLKLHIFCIMYNDYTFLEDIISKIKSNTKDQTELWIIDNSSNKNSIETIQKIARLSGIKYVQLPNNPNSGNYPLGKLLNPLYISLIRKKHRGSSSHGIAINWVNKNIIQPSGIQYYGFIDHDIIPLNGIDILKKLEDTPFYGRKQDINGLAYLWPGFCFFNRTFIQPIDLNFLPENGADTGSGNARYFLTHYNFSNFIGSDYRRAKILDGEDLQDHYIEYIDDWLHVVNASNWKNSDRHNEKIEAITKLKDQLL